MLNNIVDNIEQCGQQNIVQCCFHQARTGCAFFAVYRILKRFDQDPSCKLHEQRCHNLRKFSQIYAVSMGVLIIVLGTN